MPRYVWLIAVALVAAVSLLLLTARSTDPPTPPRFRHPWIPSTRAAADGGRPMRPHLDRVGLPRHKESQ